MKQRGNRGSANVIAVAVRIAGGPSRVAPLLGVSRSQVHRWIEAGTMARAIYMHVAALAKLSGIKIEFLGGDASPNGSVQISNGHLEATVATRGAPKAVVAKSNGDKSRLARAESRTAARVEQP